MMVGIVMTRTCNVALCEMSCTPSINLTSVSVYCDPMKQARAFGVMSFNGN